MSVLVLLVGVVVVSPAFAAPAPLRIMPLGDSITEGMHNTTPSQDGGYRHVLNDFFDASYPGRTDFVGSLTNDSAGMTDPEHEGHAGYRTDDVSAYVTSWVTTYAPDVVLLHIGTNDVDQGYSANFMTTNLQAILTKIYAARPSTQVIVSSLVPMWGPPGTWIPPTWVNYNSALPGIVTQFQQAGRSIQFADMSTGGFYYDERDFPDGTHPNDSGYAKMAAVWKPFLVRILDAQSPTPTPTTSTGTSTPTTPSPTSTTSPSPTSTTSPNTSASSAPATSVVDEKTTSGTNRFSYSGTWTDCGGCNSAAYQGSFKYAYTTGNSATFTFSGSQAKIYGFKEAVGGIASVSVDGGAAVDVDYYSASQTLSMVYSTPALSDGTHTVKITVTGRKANGASPTINVDKAEVFASAGTPSTTTTTTTPSTTTTTTPSTTTTTTPSTTTTTTPSTTTTTTPTDSAPPVVTLTAPTTGATVTVGSSVTLSATATDNVGVKTVDFSVDGTLVNSDSASPYSSSWSTSGAALGTHTIKATARDAAGNAASSSAQITIVAAPTTPALVATIDEKATSGTNKFTYSGSSWTNCAGCNGSAYLGSFKYAYTTGNSATFTFSGVQAKLYGFKEPVGGIASISIDGGTAVDVDYYATSQALGMVFSTPVLANGTHAVKITVTGRKSRGSSSTITLDKAEVYR